MQVESQQGDALPLQQSGLASSSVCWHITTGQQLSTQSISSIAVLQPSSSLAVAIFASGLQQLSCAPESAPQQPSSSGQAGLSLSGLATLARLPSSTREGHPQAIVYGGEVPTDYLEIREMK